MIGNTLGHYRIVEQIGEGGMGVVYRAHDERLDRDVAIKVLPEGVAQSRDRLNRFEREAKAIAKLDHPNILAIHDFGTEDGVTYAVMELLKGNTLRDLISEKSLTTGKAVEHAVAIADGLAAAHDKGIVHRDLKPENVFLTKDGRIKILDFGLAKLRLPETDLRTETPTETLDTAPGGAVGTVAYMPPEQIRGQTATQQSDIFALGVVIYEMLAGRRPFGGSTSVETAAAILKEDPEPISSAAPRVPPSLGKVISKCLEKRPEDRFSSAHDLSITLSAIDPAAAPPRTPLKAVIGRRWPHILAVGIASVIGILVILPPEAIVDKLTGTTDASPIRSIAILPLENLTGDPDQQYFVDGLHEELITTLAQISVFDKVIDRASVMGFRDGGTSAGDIGRQLDVAAVIRGSVRRSGETVRATLNLIDTRTEEHLWAKNFDGNLTGVLALQSEVARNVADAVDLSLSGQEATRLEQARRVDHEAYEAYLMGKHFGRGTHSEKELEKAIGFYQLAIEKDPDFARAHSHLAIAYLRLGIRFRPSEEVLPLAAQEARRALALDEIDGESYATLAGVRAVLDWDWNGADKAYRRAMELNPSSIRIRRTYSLFLAAMLRFEEAVSVREKTIELSPVSRTAYRDLGWVYWATGQYEKAASQLSAFIDKYPDEFLGRMVLSWTYTVMGQAASGVEVAEDTWQIHPAPDDDPFLLMTMAWAYGQAGESEKAESAMHRLLELRRTTYIPPSYIAYGYMGHQDADGFVEWFRQACDERDQQALMLRVLVGMQPYLGEDPRVQELIQRMNFPEN